MKILNRGGKTLVVASVRTTRMWILGSTDGLRVVSDDTPLTDTDLGGLIKALDAGGLLGSLDPVGHSMPG
jgi:hypothetical protein